jgi:hypothetical protein
MIMNRSTWNVFFLGSLFLISFCYANAQIIVLNGLTHENIAQPGDTYRGSIQIQNTIKSDKSVRVYLRDYWFSYTGESKHDPAGTLERSNAGWITYNPELLTLDSGQVANIDFEVKVPEYDTLRGTYWSVIMVEGIVPPDTTNIKRGVKIGTAIRYAVQIVTEIGNTGASDMQFLGMKLARQNEDNVLYVAVENTGERILKPVMNLELFDESGNAAGIIKSDIRKTFPGTSVMMTLVLKGIKPGNYKGVLVADCGEGRLYGTNISLDVE